MAKERTCLALSRDELELVEAYRDCTPRRREMVAELADNLCALSKNREGAQGRRVPARERRAVA